MSLSLYIESTFLHCGRVPGCVPCTYKELQCGQKGLTIDGTLIHFNFSVEVTSPVCTVPDLLQGKRVLGVWVYMYKKSCVDWKGLTVFNNQISFLSRGSVKY